MVLTQLLAYISSIFIGIVSSVNGVTKSKLTITSSARELKQADESADVKKLFAAIVMLDGVLKLVTSPRMYEMLRFGRKLWCYITNQKGNKRERQVEVCSSFRWSKKGDSVNKCLSFVRYSTNMADCVGGFLL